MRVFTSAAFAVGAVLFGLASGAAADVPVSVEMSVLNRDERADMRVLSPSGYTSRANTGGDRCAPVASSSGVFDDGPEIVRVCSPGDR